MMLEYTASFIVILEGQYYYASYYLNTSDDAPDRLLHVRYEQRATLSVIE